MDKQNITNDIKIPNNDLEILKKHFPHCFDKNGKIDFEKFKKQLSESEVSFSTESYGLEWLGKSYARLLASDPATTLLKADESHNSKPENAKSENLLIKGDNLEVLKHLVGAYYEKIKMIYIDPPYNTGNDGFVYQDDRKFKAEELAQLAGLDEEKAKRILDFTKSKSNSHSAWLTFMYPRLYIAKHLLREDGVIFVSIDDNEVAQLRLLMDEIFGEENFVANFIWRKKRGHGRGDNLVIPQTEYILNYAKNQKLLFGYRQPLSEEKLKYYKYKDEKGFYARETLEHHTPKGAYVRKTLQYDLIIDGKKIFCTTGQWLWKKDRVLDEWKKGNIDLEQDREGRWRAYKKIYLQINNEKRKEVPISLIDEPSITNNSATIELKDILGGSYYDFPKPTALIKRLILFSTGTKDDIILDFFAGSGTTGQAVWDLNKEDGGNRKFILVQLPEPIDPKKNKAAFDFVKNELKAEPTIFEITKERLIRAAKKIKSETIDTKISEKQKEIEELKSQLDLEEKDEKIKQIKQEIEALKEQNLGFRIFETMPIWKDYNFEAEQFDRSQTLFDTGKLSDDDIKALLITWKTYDGIPLTEDLESVNLDKYNAYYSNGKLYLMHKGFTPDSLKALLEKIDSDKHFEPRSIIAFGYHFESARLRELSENIKSYANKKHIDIDFVIRY